jgi:hypothetical protein
MKFSNILDSAVNLLDRFQIFQFEVQKQIAAEMKRVQRRIMLKLYQALLFGVGMLLLLAGGIVFLSRYFPSDLVILGSGLIIIYVALMIGMIKR